MDRHHDHHALVSRRTLGSLALGAVGFGLLPVMARASAEIEALCITCIDYRVLSKDDNYLANDLDLFKEADFTALAGGALAGYPAKLWEKYPSSPAAFWDQIRIAKDLHSIKKVVVIDHRDCGAYNKEFGIPRDRAAETLQHRTVMTEVAGQFRKRQPGLGLEFYLMPLVGCAERINV